MFKEYMFSGLYKIELTFQEIGKGQLSCSFDNPFSENKHTKRFQGTDKEKLKRKADRQIKAWRKDFFGRE